MRASLLRAGRLDALHELARFEGGLRARSRLLRVAKTARGVELRLEAGLASGAEPLRFVGRDERFLLSPPAALANALPEQRLDATKALRASKLDVVLRSATAAGEFLVSAEAELELGGAGADGELEPVLAAHAVVDPRTAAAGRALDAGDWKLLARVTVAGFQAEEPIRHPASRAPLVLRVDAGGGVRVVGKGTEALRRWLRRPIAAARRLTAAFRRAPARRDA